MKQIAICGFAMCLCLAVAISAIAGTRREDVPRVAYLAPDNDSEVDLTGKANLIFQWKNQPTPGGGREAYRFRLYRGFSYIVVASNELSPEVFLIEVSAGSLENGLTYSWHVEQRDASSQIWSLHDTWSFKVKK